MTEPARIDDFRSDAPRLKSETQFRHLLQALPAGAYTCDAEGLITYYNERAVKVWGRAPALNDPVDRFCGSFKLYTVDGEPIAHDQCWMALALKNSREYNGREIVIERPDGTRVTALAHANPIYDEVGTLTGAINVLVDVSEQQRDAQALRESQEGYRSLVDLAPVAVYACDADGRITLFNTLAAELWGRRPAIGDSDERFCGSFRLWRHDGSLLPHDETPMAMAIRNGQRTRNGEVVIERPDGSRIVVSVNIDPLYDDAGRITGAINVFQDVTDRSRAQVERGHLAAIIDSADDAIISKSLDGIVRTWNKAAERIFGYTAEDIVGKSITLLMPPERQNEGPRILERIRAGKPMDHFETVRRRKDGTDIEISLTVSPIKVAAGRVIGASKIARDISKHKAAERALSESEERLREHDRRKDEFIATLSHELRNPLAPLRMVTEIVRTNAGANSRLQWAAGLIERQVKHLGRLVDDLLDLSRIANAEVALVTAPADLRDIVWQAVEMNRAAVEAKRHNLWVDVPERRFHLDCDAARLVQVVSNLLSNAVKYTPRGGSIHVAAATEGSSVALHVRDSGAGITADVLPHVFDMFVQGSQTVARAEGGLGIGLTLVKRIVMLHGGDVTAASEGPGKGSEFIVRLPLVGRVHTADRRQDEAQGAAFVPGRRILIADDNPDITEALATLLRQFGHEVRTAGDGIEALEAARDFLPDVAVIDIGLPGHDGCAVAQQMRQDPRFKHTLLVAHSGYGHAQHRDASRAAGFDHHLVKPVDPYELQALLAT